MLLTRMETRRSDACAWVEEGLFNAKISCQRHWLYICVWIRVPHFFDEFSEGESTYDEAPKEAAAFGPAF